jgi:hypothetical protein
VIAAVFAMIQCNRAAPVAPQATTVSGAVSDLARCAFDEPTPLLSDRPQARLEGALRRALRNDRYAFSVRAGRCASAVSEPLRASDARARALGEAWDGLLPLAQSPRPDDILLEQSIRRIGRAWNEALTAR